MKDYRKLVVWEKAHKLTLFIYNITQAFPKEEQYGLISQIRRAATSTPTNIAEGCGKNTQLDFARYLQHAFGSMQEVQYLSFLSFELKYLDRENLQYFRQRHKRSKGNVNRLNSKSKKMTSFTLSALSCSRNYNHKTSFLLSAESCPLL